MANASSISAKSSAPSKPSLREPLLEEWILPRKDGSLDVVLFAREEPSERTHIVVDETPFFALHRLHSAQHVFHLVMGWPEEQTTQLHGKAVLRFAVIIAGDEGPMGDRPVVGPDESPLSSSVKLAELLQVLSVAAYQLALPVHHFIPQGAQLVVVLDDDNHCIASWILLRAFMETALSARGLLLDDAVVELQDETLALDGSLLMYSSDS
ncbi:MAG: hypothetical protein GY822_13180 [Deltaproteobacteria bacterium]|nr:hypothetical protein [Deltaproteobacteria bacterium]